MLLCIVKRLKIGEVVIRIVYGGPDWPIPIMNIHVGTDGTNEGGAGSGIQRDNSCARHLTETLAASADWYCLCWLHDACDAGVWNLF